MEYGIDRNGREVHHSRAVASVRYSCPYCMEALILRRGQKPCFAHNVIKERTPLQRTCPEYHENAAYTKINDSLDIVYINNGGIPLYLCNKDSQFELRAYFPKIRENSMQKLVEDNTKIIINQTQEYYVQNLTYYKVDYIKRWIEVKTVPDTLLKDVCRKWLWGIKGINIETDLYHAYSEGGNRLAIKADVYVGKTYRILFRDKAKNVRGIVFNHVGRIKLSEGRQPKEFLVYELQVKVPIEEARQFIEGKGYHLIEKPNKIIPLWPPAIASGNELTVNANNAWFLHSKGSEKEYLQEIQDSGIRQVLGSEIIKITNIARAYEKTLILSNRLFEAETISKAANEIKYMLHYRQKLQVNKVFLPDIKIQDTEGQEVDFNQESGSLPKNRKLYFAGNVPMRVLLKQDDYCLSSGERYLEDIGYGKTVVIDCKAFGQQYYEYKDLSEEIAISQQIAWRDVYQVLYRCRGAVAGPTSRNKLLLEMLDRIRNQENDRVYRLLYGWVQRQSVPIHAQRYLEELLERVLG